MADSDDGLGAELISEDQSWHPFFNKIYQKGKLTQINMPKAEIGFAIASHYLWMAGGTRWIVAEIAISGYSGVVHEDLKNEIKCLLTSKKEWIEKVPLFFSPTSANTFLLVIAVNGEDPPITPYLSETHGYTFETNLPILLIKIKQQKDNKYAYSKLQNIVVTGIELHVFVTDLKMIAVSNDFGPVDTSKPFQPFGAQPVNGASFTVGSKEVFQKKLISASLIFDWKTPPSYYNSTTPNVTSTPPEITTSYLVSGGWSAPDGSNSINTTRYSLDVAGETKDIESVDLSENEPYSLKSRNGYVRLIFNGDLGFNQYQIDLEITLQKLPQNQHHILVCLYSDLLQTRSRYRIEPPRKYY